MQILSLFLLLVMSCNEAGLNSISRHKSTQQNNAQNAQESLDNELNDSKDPSGHSGSEMAEEELPISPPQSVGGAYFTCQSKGYDTEKGSSGATCSYVSENGDRPDANDGREYNLEVSDLVSQGLLQVGVFPPPSTEPAADWYLTILHPAVLQSYKVLLIVKEKSTQKELHRLSSTLNVRMDLAVPTLSLTGAYTGLTFGGGSYATASGSLNACPLSKTVPVKTEKIVIDVPYTATVLTLNLSQVCDVGVPAEFKDDLAQAPMNLVRLKLGEKIIESWVIPLDQANAIQFKTKTALAVGLYTLEIVSNPFVFKISSSQVEYDNFSIGKLSVQASQPVALFKPQSRNVNRQEFGRLILTSPNGDGLEPCRKLVEQGGSEFFTAQETKSYFLEVLSDGEVGILLSEICGLGNFGNTVRIYDFNRALVYQESMDSNAMANQFSMRVKLLKGRYRLALFAGTTGFTTDEFGMANVIVEGPIKVKP